MTPTGLAGEFTIPNNDFTPTDGYFRPAGEFDTVVRRPVDVFVQEIGGECHPAVRIKDDQVGVVTDGDISLGVEARQPCGCRAAQFHPTVE